MGAMLPYKYLRILLHGERCSKAHEARFIDYQLWIDHGDAREQDFDRLRPDQRRNPQLYEIPYTQPTGSADTCELFGGKTKLDSCPTRSETSQRRGSTRTRDSDEKARPARRSHPCVSLPRVRGGFELYHR